VKLTRQERYRAIESNPQHREYKVTMLRKARNRAKKRNIYFNLTLNDFHIGEKCPILGTPFKVGLDNWQNSPSLDRIDNRRGYEKGNVIVVCMMANSIKNQATPSQIKKVADFYEKLYEEKAIDIS
tara:strand:+ start:17 stop:394 length:378 start_codon:yes stop_codon:yes gene_type:complete